VGSVAAWLSFSVNVRRFPQSRSERLVLMDSLIHRFHWESEDSGGGRPGAVNLIEGKMKNIMPFLDRLSYGGGAPPELERMRQEWRRKWRENPCSHGKGQTTPKPRRSTAGAE
jgi:hypothetical protein